MKRCIVCDTVYASNAWSCSSCGYAPREEDGFPSFAPELAKGGAGFPTGAFELLVVLEEKNFWFRARNTLIVSALQSFFPNMHRYLEIGCGTGYVLSGVAKAFPQCVITGSEVFSVGLSCAARRSGQADLIQMDARRIPFVDEFDVIGAFDVLEHIMEDDLVLAEALRALRPDGGIVITVPQHPWLWSQVDEQACHVRRYSRSDLINKVQGAGFRVEYVTSFVTLLLPAMALSRILKPRLRAETDPLAELRLPGMINSLFSAAMVVERAMIANGLRMPVGGSLLLVARKTGTRQ